jgi:multidrug resistance efflux pump
MLKRKDIYELKERSEFVQEILGKLPPLTIRLGTIFFFVFILILIFLSYLTKYPDIVKSQILITTRNPSVRLFSLVSGKIQHLLIKDSDTVKIGQILAVIENPASLTDVLYIENKLNELDQSKSIDSVSLNISNNLKLGTIQNRYSELMIDLREYIYFTKGLNYLERVNAIQAQINSLTKLNKSLAIQKNIYRKEIELAKASFNRNEILFDSKTISKADFEIAESSYLSYMRELEDIEIQIINGEIRIQQFQSQIADLKFQKVEQDRSRLISLKEKFQIIKSDIVAWKQNYIITSPISGIVSFHNVWSINQFINNREELFVLVPLDEQITFGKIIIPEQNFGKVAVGQRVIIKLETFNFREFGIINGTIASVSLTPKDKFFTADVELTNGLTSSYGKLLGAGQEVQGSADIVTEDLRLIERIFYDVRSLVVNN